MTVADEYSKRCIWSLNSPCGSRILSTVINERTLGWYSTKVYTERLRPKVQPLTLLYTIFDKKGTPFVYLLLTNCIPSTYLVSLEILIPFNCCKCTVFKYDYYPFKIFPWFWLAKSTRIIHHNQLLMTKFGRILCLTRKWRQKCSLLQVNAPLTEKTWGRGWVVLVVKTKMADISLVSRVRTRRDNS